MHINFTPNPALTIEDFGDEIVMVNLRNGAYFTLKSSACLIWRIFQQFSEGHGLPEQLSAEYTLDLSALQQVTQLLHQWKEDGLADFSDQWLETIAAFTPSEAQGKPPLPLPDYEQFTNMQDILLLDPIHDVGELGWPHAKPE